MKYIFSEKLKDELPHIFGLFHDLMQQQNGLDYFECVFRYLMSAAETITQENLLENVKKQIAEGERIMATIAQKYYEKGEQTGIEKGALRELIAGIELDLKFKFGKSGVEELAWIRKMKDIERLRKIRLALKQVESLDELRKNYK